MKLSRIPGHESTVKHSFAFKQSTATLLLQYQEMYASHTGIDVSMKDVVEQMLLDFIADDKAFQKAMRQKQEAAAQPAPAQSAPVAPAAVKAEPVALPSSGDNSGSY